MAKEAKAIRYFRQKLSHDVEVELCFTSTTVDVVGSNDNSDKVSVDASNVAAHRIGEDDTSNVPSPVFHIDLSNFSGRLTIRRIADETKEVDEDEAKVIEGTRDGSDEQSEGSLPALPLPLQAPLDDYTQTVRISAHPGEGPDTTTSEEGSTRVTLRDVSHVTMAGLAGRGSIDSFGRPQQDSTSSANSNAFAVKRNRRTSRESILRSMLRKDTSMRDFTKLPGLATGWDPLQTDLHELVSSPDLTVRRMEDMIANDPDAVKVTDSQGRLPLHVLASNSDLLSSPDGQLIARQCSILLMQLNVDSILHKDKEGKMPFVFLIQKWVEWTHEQDTDKTNRDSDKGKSRTVASKLIKMVQSGTRSTATRTESNASARTEIASGGSSLRDSSNQFPPVQIFDEVEWCFEMLSMAMDHLGGKPLDPTLKVRPRLSYRKQRKDRQELAENLASIPQVMKTTLLLESNTIRNKIMDSSAVRRALLCHQSIGPWLTSMLLYKKGTSSEIGVNFLLTLSQLSVKDYVGNYRKALPHDEEQFDAAKLQVYEAVQSLKDIVPSLLILNDNLLDNALATPLIWFVMNRQIVTPFTVGISVTDFQLLFTTIIAVRQASFGLVPDEGNPEVFPFLNVLLVVFFACLYGVLRRMCEAYALYRISRKVAYRYCTNGWHVLDFIGVASALWASAYYGSLESGEESDTHPIFVALILGLLWIRVLSYLKAVNEHLATFILALTRIFFDIRFFCVVLLIVVLMFGDMMHVLFVNDLDQQCDSQYLDPASADFCNTDSMFHSYLRVYAIIIGDFDLTNFQEDPVITVMWFFVTFVGLVVMLNTLIAVITTSYDRSEKTSIILFRRARCEFVASNAAIEGFLRPRLLSASRWRLKIDLGFVISSIARWVLILTFLVTVVFSSLYLLQRLIKAAYEDRILTVLVMVSLCIVMACTFWAAFGYFFGVMLQWYFGKSSRVTQLVDAVNKNVVERVAAQMFGVDVTDTRGGEVVRLKIDDGQDNELFERIDRLEKLLENVLLKNGTKEVDDTDLESTGSVWDKHHNESISMPA